MNISAAYAETFARVELAGEPPEPIPAPPVFALERFSDVIEEARPLLARHWGELALNRDKVPLNPDFDRYDAIDATGALRVYTARLAGRLVGYAAYLVGPNLHYQTIIATSDLFWVSPEHRGREIGRGLFEFVERSLRAEGADGIYTTSKLAHPAAAAVLESLGHRPIEVAHFKLLRSA